MVFSRDLLSFQNFDERHTTRDRGRKDMTLQGEGVVRKESESIRLSHIAIAYRLVAKSIPFLQLATAAKIWNNYIRCKKSKLNFF